MYARMDFLEAKTWQDLRMFAKVSVGKRFVRHRLVATLFAICSSLPVLPHLVACRTAELSVRLPDCKGPYEARRLSVTRCLYTKKGISPWSLQLWLLRRSPSGLIPGPTFNITGVSCDTPTITTSRCCSCEPYPRPSFGTRAAAPEWKTCRRHLKIAMEMGEVEDPNIESAFA